MNFRVSLVLSLLFAGIRTSFAQVAVYPAPEGADLNNDFAVEVVQNGKSYDSPAYNVRVARVENAKKTVENSSFTQFSFDGKIDIAVRYNKGRVDSARIRPLSYGIKPRIEGNTLHFSIDKPMNISVEVNGDIHHNLQLFACPPEQNVPKKRAKNVVYYAPGVHKIAGDTLRIPSNTTVYLAGGAVVKGHLLVADAHDVRICGRGVIDCNLREPVYIKNSRNVEVSGLVMSQCPVGGSSRVHINNVKVISSFGWGDGLNVFASDSVTYDNCFARTSDDCTTVYATRKGFVGGAKDITMTNSVLWADVAHPIFIGLHGMAAYDIKSEKTDTIERVCYRNIDILEQNEYQIDYQGCMAIGCGDLNVVRDVLFEDIRVEQIRNGQLFNIRTTWNEKYCAAPGRLVENITFRNVCYNGALPNLSIMEGYGPEHPVRNITFENLRINGRLITDDMKDKPKWYKTADFANAYAGANVYGLRFVYLSNLDGQHLKP